MKTKYFILLTSLIFFTSFSTTQCAKVKPDIEAEKIVGTPYDQGESQSLITLTNSSGHDLWISVKAGGEFTDKIDPVSSIVTHTRKSGGVALLSDPLIPSGQSRAFDKHNFQNLTIRIFETENDLLLYKHSKFGMLFTPVDMAGLKEITITFSVEHGYVTTKRKNFVGFECGFCLEPICDGEVVAIAEPCAHKLHQKCIDAWIDNAKSPHERTDRQKHCILCHRQIERYIYCNATRALYPKLKRALDRN
ncbi:MAG: RING finger domain-containing protein [bacterium]